MLNEINTILAEADLLVNEQQIAAAIAKIAEQINSQLADRNPLVLCDEWRLGLYGSVTPPTDHST